MSVRFATSTKTAHQSFKGDNVWSIVLLKLWSMSLFVINDFYFLLVDTPYNGYVFSIGFIGFPLLKIVENMITGVCPLLTVGGVVLDTL